MYDLLDMDTFIYYLLGYINSLNDSLSTCYARNTVTHNITPVDSAVIFSKINSTYLPFDLYTNVPMPRTIRLAKVSNDIYITSIGMIVKRSPFCQYVNISELVIVPTSVDANLIIGIPYVKSELYNNNINNKGLLDILALVNYCFSDIFNFNGCNDDYPVTMEELVDEFKYANSKGYDAKRMYDEGYEYVFNLNIPGITG